METDIGPLYPNKDGSPFRNDQGVLINKPLGTYREFTVEDPAYANRGVQRFVVDMDTGDIYYSNVHYEESTWWIVQ